MFKIRINVPRVFYLNSKELNAEKFPGRHVNKTLPHGKHSHNLIEVYVICSFTPLHVTIMIPIPFFKYDIFQYFSSPFVLNFNRL